jgi:FixJ family two-component response regulator
MKKTPVIHVVDDDQAFQTAVSRLLRAAGYEVQCYTNAGNFLIADYDGAPGCILLDVRMPGPSGLDLQQALSMQIEPMPVIFISGYSNVPITVQAMKAGAMDFLTKPVQRKALLNAVENALAYDAKRRVVREQLKSWQECFERLTPRELEVFEGVIAGKLNKEIADELSAAERTIKAHRAQVMTKMRAGSLAELVHIADQLQASGIGPANALNPTII